MKRGGCKQRQRRCISLLRLNWINEFAAYPNKISGYSFRFNFSCPFQSFFWHSVSHQLQPKNRFQPRLDVAQQQAEKAQRAKLQVEEVGYGWSLISRDLFGTNTRFFWGGRGLGTRNRRSWEHSDLFCWVNRCKLVYVLSLKSSERIWELISCEFSMWRKQLPPLSLCIYFNLEPSKSWP